MNKYIVLLVVLVVVFLFLEKQGNAKAKTKTPVATDPLLNTDNNPTSLVNTQGEEIKVTAIVLDQQPQRFPVEDFDVFTQSISL